MQSIRNVVLRPGARFDSLKVFSATMHGDRAVLGDKVTAWLADHPNVEATEMCVTQSSDASFHCITIVVFYRANRATA
jgi:hypothetical protein